MAYVLSRAKDTTTCRDARRSEWSPPWRSACAAHRSVPRPGNRRSGTEARGQVIRQGRARQANSSRARTTSSSSGRPGAVPARRPSPISPKLQKKHPDVPFIGVSVFEQDPAAVEPFVKEMGDKMAYRVAMDAVPEGKERGDGAMAKTWMEASRSGRESRPPSSSTRRARSPGSAIPWSWRGRSRRSSPARGT